MEFTISPQANSIIVPIPLKLGNYTVFAGVNNSGKTNIINALIAHDDIKKKYGKRIVHIPADSIHPENKELKRSAIKDSFYQLLDSILDPIFKASMFDGLVKDFENSLAKQTFIKNVNDELQRLGASNQNFDIKILSDDLTRDIVIKQAVKAFTKDTYTGKDDEIDLDNIGMGAQRMIIASLLQVYSQTKEDEETLVVIEEPEVYLHPAWKMSLSKALISLSNNPKIRVVVTTHDPYFIELGIGQTIYIVSRDTSKKGATKADLYDKGPMLCYRSDAEANYLVFGVSSKTYFLELFEHLFDYLDFKQTTEEKDDRYGQFRHWLETRGASEIYSTRCKISHPKEKVVVTEGQIKIGIEKLAELIAEVATPEEVTI